MEAHVLQSEAELLPVYLHNMSTSWVSASAAYLWAYTEGRGTCRWHHGCTRLRPIMQGCRRERETVPFRRSRTHLREVLCIHANPCLGMLTSVIFPSCQVTFPATPLSSLFTDTTEAFSAVCCLEWIVLCPNSKVCLAANYESCNDRLNKKNNEHTHECRGAMGNSE